MDKGEFYHQDKNSASRKRRNRKKRRHEKQAAISGFKDAYQNLVCMFVYFKSVRCVVVQNALFKIHFRTPCVFSNC